MNRLLLIAAFVSLVSVPARAIGFGGIEVRTLYELAKQDKPSPQKSPLMRGEFVDREVQDSPSLGLRVNIYRSISNKNMTIVYVIPHILVYRVLTTRYQYTPDGYMKRNVGWEESLKRRYYGGLELGATVINRQKNQADVTFASFAVGIDSMEKMSYYGAWTPKLIMHPIWIGMHIEFFRIGDSVVKTMDGFCIQIIW